MKPERRVSLQTWTWFRGGVYARESHRHSDEGQLNAISAAGFQPIPVTGLTHEGYRDG